VSLIDPKLDVPTRIRWGFLEDGTRVRVSKKSGTVMPKPKTEKPEPQKAGPLDTPQEFVLKKTFDESDLFPTFEALRLDKLDRLRAENDSLLKEIQEIDAVVHEA